MQLTKFCAIVIALVGTTLSAQSQPATQPVRPRIPAFPGAEGYGMFTTGGRGGDVYEVTTLADAGPGSLRDGVSQPNRTIVFRVAGNIELQSTLFLNQPNITIVGQTAPGDGVCLKNYALRVNTRNVIIRYLRVRVGDDGRDAQADGISMGPRGGSDWIFDHCSVSWAIDENFSVYGLPNVSVQWCIISEALFRSNHPKVAHSMGGILNGHDMTMHHNVFAHNNDRNPKFNIADWWPGQNTDFRNNVVYNWGARATWGGNGGSTLTNVINNYYKPGPNSRDPRAFLTLEDGTPGEWHVGGNFVEGADPITADNWSGVINTTRGMPQLNGTRIEKAFSAAPVLTEGARDAYAAVLKLAGATVPKRDSVDARVLNDIVNGTGKIIDHPSDVGGWPELKPGEAPADGDHDGMPDAWEVASKLDPKDPADRNGVGADGYTNLERYLNSLVPAHSTLDARVKPAEAFWPFPNDGAEHEDDTPTLTWKAGFATLSERVYFGTRPKLAASDLKQEKPYSRRNVEKQVVTSCTFDPGLLKSGTTYYWRVDGVNEYGVTSGPTWSFTPGSPAAGPTGASTRMEAENMTLGRAYVEDTRGASGGKVTSVPGDTGAIRFTFTRPAGAYRIDVCYIDERDGVAPMSLWLNGKKIDSWTASLNNDRFVTHSTENVQLKPGDMIKVTAGRNRDELGRVDYVETVPAAATTRPRE